MATRLAVFLLVALAVSASGPAPPLGPPSDAAWRPNVVWIVADDLSPILAAYGDSTARTPHLDRLAAEGTVYERAYVTSPVCAPSRTSLLTGLHPAQMGALHMRTMRRTSAIDQITDPELLAIPTYEAVPPPDVTPLPILLQRAGYWAANRRKEDYQFAVPPWTWAARGDTAHWRLRPVAGAVGVGGASAQPFFFVDNNLDTHESQIWRRDDEPLAVDPATVPLPPYYPDTPLVRRDVARNYSNAERFDAAVGRVLAELEADGLLEETVVFVTSDHGDGLPRAKRELHDSGLRVPLLVRVGAEVRRQLEGQVRFPEPGTRSDRVVSLVDLPAEVLRLAGVEVPAAVAGRPFLDEDEPAVERRQYAFGAKGRMDPALNDARAVTDGRYKLILNLRPERPYVQFLPYRDQQATMRELTRLHAEGGLDPVQALWFRPAKPVVELFDTHSDPHEVRDLAASPALAEKRAELLGALRAWMARTNDAGALAETELVRRLWPGGVQPETAAPEAVVETTASGRRVALASPTDGALVGVAVGDTTGWRPYAGPFEVPAGMAVFARAHRLGWRPSPTTRVGVP